MGVDFGTKIEQKINIREHRGVSNMTDLVHDVLSFISVSLFIATFAIWVSAI
jgi:hypothetical protein